MLERSPEMSLRLETTQEKVTRITNATAGGNDDHDFIKLFVSEIMEVIDDPQTLVSHGVRPNEVSLLYFADIPNPN